ncbi:MAG: DUF167 domain-containing protein [Firmicutes bacterium]|nr:DUF167 domain-containing protein [Bacillota bacterium]
MERVSASLGCEEDDGMFQATKGGYMLAIKVVPNAGENKIVIDTQDNVKIKTTATPADGKANESVIDILSKACKVPKTKIVIKAGHTSKNKLVLFLTDNEPSFAKKDAKFV